MTLEELQIKFTADTAGLNSELNNVKQSVSAIEAPTGRAHNALAGLSKIGGLLAAAGIGAKLISIGSESLEMANAVAESESLFSVSMGDMAEDARAWSEGLSDALGVNAYAVRKNVGILNTMFKSMGLGKKSSSDMSKQLVQLAEDMASFYNLDPEEAFVKLQAGITGEAEGLKRLGIMVDETTVKNYALRTGMIRQGKEMTNAQKVAARYAVILEQTGDAQGDLARTMSSPTNQLRKLRNEFDQAKIALGQALQPALLAVLPVLTKLATGAKNVIGSLTGTGESASTVFDDVVVTLAQAKTDVAAAVTTTYTDTVAKLTQLKTDTETALAAYIAEEKKTKKLAIDLNVTTTTTGVETIIGAMVGIQLTVANFTSEIRKPIVAHLDAQLAGGEIDQKTYNEKILALDAELDKLNKNAVVYATETEAKVNTALLDGVVTEAEGTDIKKTVIAAAAALIASITAEAIAQKKAVDVMVEKGEIKAAEGLDWQTEIDTWAATAIAGVTAKANIASSITVGEPTTTGQERIQTAITTLQETVKGYTSNIYKTVYAHLVALLDGGEISQSQFNTKIKTLNTGLNTLDKKAVAFATSVTASVNTALANGTVTEKEAGGIEKSVTAKAKSIIDAITKEAIAQKKAVDVLVEKGKIYAAAGLNWQTEIDTWATNAIAGVTASVTAVKAELGSLNWTEKTFSPEEVAAISAVVTAGINASENLVTAAVNQVQVTFANADVIGVAVNTLYAGLQDKVTALNAELSAIMGQWVDGAAPTAEDWAKVLEIRAERDRMLAIMSGGLTSGGALTGALVDLTLNTESIKNYFKAYAESFTTESNSAAQTLAAQKIILQNAFGQPEFSGILKGLGLAGMTIDGAIAALNTRIETALSAGKSQAIINAAARLMPSIASAIASGDAGQVEHAMSGLMTFISSLAADFGSLTPEAQAAVNSMIAEFDLAPMSDKARLAMMNVKIEMLGLLPEIEQLLKDRGAAAIQALSDALFAGAIDGDDYNAIIGAASSKTALEQLKAQFVTDGNDAAAGLVDGLLAHIAEVEEAARLLKEASTPEEPATEGIGKAGAEQVTSEITAEVPNTEAAASGLGKAAMDSLRKALEDGSISAETYDAIILANSTGTLTDLATKFREASKTSLAGFIEELLSKSEEIVTAAKDVAGDAVVPAIDNTAIGENAASSVATGMNNKLPDVTKAADGIAAEVNRALKAGLLIGSPSKVGIGIGEFVGEGLAIGMDNMTDRVYASSMGLADRAALGLRGISGDAGLNIDSETNTGDIIQAATRQAVESVLDKLNITLEVDGTQLGRASIKAINDTTRRTGRTLLVTT